MDYRKIDVILPHLVDFAATALRLNVPVDQSRFDDVTFAATGDDEDSAFKSLAEDVNRAQLGGVLQIMGNTDICVVPTPLKGVIAVLILAVPKGTADNVKKFFQE